MKIDQLFSCNNYTEKKKVRVAVMNLSHNALVWWNHGKDLSTWDEMKNMMRLCFALAYYLECHTTKKEENVGENKSDDEMFSSKKVNMNSNDISLSSGVETILQD